MAAIPFERFRHKILELYPERSFSPATVRVVLQVLRELDELRSPDGKRKLIRSSADLTSDVIVAWMGAYPERGTSRFESLLRTLQPMIRFAISKGYLGREDDPFGFRSARKWAQPGSKPSPRRSPVRSRSADQIGMLLRLLDQEAANCGWKERRLQALAYFYAYTGVRKCEALMLPVPCVDLRRKAFRLEARDDWSPKTVKSVSTLPLAEPLVDVLRLWLPMTGGEWVFPGVRLKTPWLSGAPGTKPLDQIKAAAQRAGIGDFTILGFRKSLGTLATFMDISDSERRRVFRHTEDRTAINWYEDPLLEEMRPTVAKIAFGGANV